ncbi:MAG TPA: acido-empty-quinoprotein group A [Candidatus Acidoferrum sp.]|jgi:alcohol dehydrogenase (cytochrome c)|nr:acido-empty-quinoprotein group A [Candidatus Acidoferrum sp.]
MRRLATFAIALLLLAPGLIFAQSGVDPADLLKPLGNNWPIYSGDYTGKRYSSLKLINQSNVHNLSLAWVARFTAGSGPDGYGNGTFGGGRGGGIGATAMIVGGLGTGDLNPGGPARIGGGILMVDGVLYLTSPDNAWAVDARDGSIIWHYYWKTRGGTHTGNRGLGMYHNWLYLETHDDMLVSLDAKTGKERWHKEIAPFDQQYFSSMSPIVVGNHLLIGTGDDIDAPGYLQSVDPETGDRQWISYTVPMKAGDVGVDSWASLDAASHGGAQVWMPGAYDPETHLYIFGTGNPTPAYTTGRGDGDNLFACTMIAVDIDTGKMKWYYQTSPHDTHDWDTVQTPILVDAPFQGKQRKMVMQAARNGYFFVLDRATGEHLVTGKFGTVNNWAVGLDDKGRPRRNPEKDATIAGSIVNTDVTNVPPSAYSPDTGLFFAPEDNSLHISYLIDPDPRGSMGLGGTTSGAGMAYGTNIVAIDYKTGKIVWRHPVQSTAGLLTTAGKLLFSGDGANLVAYDPANGNPLWHSRIGNTGNAPETYMLDGLQYVIATGDDQLFAFVLNAAPVAAAPAKKPAPPAGH